MTWSYWFCDTITGAKILEVEPAGGSWSRRLNTAGSGQHVFTLGDGVHTRAEWRNATIAWDRTLVVCWDDEPVYAGLITGRPYSYDTKVLTVQHVDLRALFLYRLPFGENSYWEDESAGIPGKLTISSKSLVSTLGLVLEAGTTGPVGGADYSLPLVLPSLSTAGSFSTTYENYNFQRVADILEEIQEMDGGPDVEFSPQWSGSDTLEWVVRAGALTGGSFTFDLTTTTHGVSSYVVNENAQKQVTGVFGVGENYGTSMVVGGTPGVPVASIPARDDVVAWKMVKTNEHASQLAKERVRAFKNPTVQPDIRVMATVVSPADLVLGSSVTVVIEADEPFLPDASKTYRLIGLSADVGLEVSLLIEEEAV
jgi:hypothetical protein